MRALVCAAVILVVVSAPGMAHASRCYAKVGKACVKKSYGTLDSKCENKCANARSTQPGQANACAADLPHARAKAPATTQRL